MDGIVQLAIAVYYFLGLLIILALQRSVVFLPIEEE
jgi:hypothetical protein